MNDATPPVHDGALGDAHDARCEICHTPCRWRVCYGCAQAHPESLLEAAADLVIETDVEPPLDITDAATGADAGTAPAPADDIPLDLSDLDADPV